MRILLPIASIGIAALGMYMALTRRLRFYELGRVSEFMRIDPRYSGDVAPLYYCIQTVREGVKGEVFNYYSFHRVYLPSDAIFNGWKQDNAYIASINRRIGGTYSYRIGGACMYFISTLPSTVVSNDGLGMLVISPEHQFGTFCREFGVPIRNVYEVMNWMRSLLFQTMVDDGRIDPRLIRC